ncbi:Aste57867_12802 [Aphanomyces stellatus]|uniref:Aste57867_12802 protein n=1 Tax=Aphanomyces stellatus TaxID=120398 RepID=A0A485KWI5_9STRA|nr:hypothetical protein As57867_012754 [Aphanomyces stellatus]VFT89651.1 Aste57867_12802 [Aphanomyces stellatus]
MIPRRFSMVALDLDGTLLNAASHVSARTSAALQHVAATGAIISLCSGRSTACMVDAEQQLGLPHPCAVLSCNGAAAFDLQRRPLYVDTMSPASVRAVLQCADELELVTNLYDEVRGVIHARPTHPDHHALIQRYATRTGGQFNLVESYDDLSPPCQVALLCDDVAAVHAALVARITSHELQVNAYSYFVECVPRNVHKGVGLERLAAHLGVPLTQTVAFGDGRNDLEFVQTAGLGIAMANAIDAVKEVAARVTQHTHDHDGVAIELEAMLAQDLFGPPMTMPEEARCAS